MSISGKIAREKGNSFIGLKVAKVIFIAVAFFIWVLAFKPIRDIKTWGKAESSDISEEWRSSLYQGLYQA
ncbi:hypothetical protein [Bartonella florencae]|uniref:hypothetical protein n=1 Tax=Bartonella florencae TaxID=928210 RepID=UPI0002F10E1A|nr:hypothetical protein [Bartonella florencae]